MQLCYSISANIHKHYCCAFQFFFSFIFENKGRKQMVVVVCGDKEIIFKNKKI